MSVVGDNIRALRTLYGEGCDITQVELAEIIGVTRETVNKWEAGSIGNVRTSNINRLREYFGLTVDDLRSEANGLAAQLRAKQATQDGVNKRADDFKSLSIPLVSLDDLRGQQDELLSDDEIEVPQSLAKQTRRMCAFVVEDDTMTLVLPKGSHAVVDLDAVPQTGSIVVVDVPNATGGLLVRRLHCGTTKAMLSSEGLHATDDIVLELSDVHVIGAVVWYQSAKVLQ